MQAFVNTLQITNFLPEDVIIKQGDIGDLFYLILDGICEVNSEHRDFSHYDHRQVLMFLGKEDQIPDLDPKTSFLERMVCRKK